VSAPLVSVLMPVRNGLPFLREALDSLSGQTLRDIEIIALEDGSTDGTPQFLAAWSDARLRIIHTGGVGIGAALNAGLEAARAPLIARQDADDVSLPERLAAQAAYLAEVPDVGVVGTTAEYIDERGERVDNDWVRTVRQQQDVACDPARIAELMPLTCCLTHGSVMARTALMRAAGGYRGQMSPAEDYDLWLRLLPETRLAKLPQRLYRYRVHGSQASATAPTVQLMNTLLAKFAYVRKTHPHLPARARLVVIGSGRGAACYRALAPAQGFEVVPPPTALGRDQLPLLKDPTIRRWALEGCDALVVTNFADVQVYADALGASPDGTGPSRVGNFFVPRPDAGRRTA
jgi:GT2 family glycosyltransferase